MADRSKKKQRGKAVERASNKPSKEEDAIARFVRFNCPTNATMFEGNEVHYFSGKKAVELLVDSKKYGAKSKAAKFPTNAAAEQFLGSLLERGLFFRARKVVLKKKDKPAAAEKKAAPAGAAKASPAPSPKPQKGKATATVAAEEVPAPDAEAEVSDGAEEQQQEDTPAAKKQQKKKVRLIAHDQQHFGTHDPSDVYVWVFDPTPLYKKAIGLLIVLGTIAGCLFPLWPDWLRLGIYYLSVSGIALFGLLLGVALARTVLFGAIWLATMGRHKLWVLPNLTEDCGILESFRPFYTYEYCPGDAPAAGGRRKKHKDEGAQEALLEEPSTSQAEQAPPPADEVKEDTGGKAPPIQDEQTSEDEDDEAEEDENHPSDELSESSSPSQTESDEDAEPANASIPVPEAVRQRKNVGAIDGNRRSQGDDDYVMVEKD